jgi:hypothetical protein
MARSGTRPAGNYPIRNEHAKPRRWGGVEWESWSVGVAQYERRTPDGRGAIREASSHRMTYFGIVDGALIQSSSGKPKAFRSEEAAALAVLAATTQPEST